MIPALVMLALAVLIIVLREIEHAERRDAERIRRHRYTPRNPRAL